MVRRRSCAISNHEFRNPSLETPRKRAAPQDEDVPRVDFAMPHAAITAIASEISTL
jgi:hypothetical protein